MFYEQTLSSLHPPPETGVLLLVGEGDIGVCFWFGAHVMHMMSGSFASCCVCTCAFEEPFQEC